MKRSRLQSQARARLDERLREFGAPARFAQPVHGWVRAVREALGRSTTPLAGAAAGPGRED